MCNLLVYYKITQKSTPGETPGFSSTNGINNNGVKGLRGFSPAVKYALGG